MSLKPITSSYLLSWGGFPSHLQMFGMSVSLSMQVPQEDVNAVQHTVKVQQVPPILAEAVQTGFSVSAWSHQGHAAMLSIHRS